MKRISITFLQVVTVLVGAVVLAALIRLPLTEGRAANLSLVSIYADPFILYGYLASIVFFISLYKAFRLLGYIGQNKAFSSSSVENLQSIRRCAIAWSVLIAGAGLYIRIFHSQQDDPAGFLAICIVTIFISSIVAAAATVIEKILREAIGMKSSNSLTI